MANASFSNGLHFVPSTYAVRFITVTVRGHFVEQEQDRASIHEAMEQQTLSGRSNLNDGIMEIMDVGRGGGRRV